LKYFRWHIKRFLDGLPDFRIRDIQAQPSAPRSQKPTPANPLYSTLDLCTGIDLVRFYYLLL
jgi:hypothetical protein